MASFMLLVFAASGGFAHQLGSRPRASSHTFRQSLGFHPLLSWAGCQCHIPYCYYYLQVLYFANFCDLEKIAKLSTRKNFYQQIRDSCVYNHKLRDVFRQLWSMHSHSLLVVSAFSFLPCHHELEKVTFDDIDYSGSFTSKT